MREHLARLALVVCVLVVAGCVARIVVVVPPCEKVTGTLFEHRAVWYVAFSSEDFKRFVEINEARARGECRGVEAEERVAAGECGGVCG